MALGQLMTYGSFFGAIIALISFLWAVVNSIVNRVEKSKNRSIEFQHKKNQILQKEKAELLKENEKIKQRYVQEMIDEVTAEVKAVDAKVQKMLVNYARVDEKLKASVGGSNRVIKKVECFVDATNKRFETVEKELNEYRSEHIEIGKDLVLLKSLANNIRNKQG